MEDFVQSVPAWADGADSVLLAGIRDLLRSLADSTSIPGLAEQIDSMIEPIEDRLHSDFRNDLVYQQFGHLLEQLASLETIDQQVVLLRNTPYDLSCLEQPEALIDQFRPASQAEARMVAMAIKFRCGEVLYCHEMSCITKRPMTILDSLASRKWWSVESARLLLLEAFAATGFRRARDCSPDELYTGWRHVMGDAEFDSTIVYDLTRMRRRGSELTRELTEYLFHPKRVGKWLQTNPDKHVGDYLAF